MDRGKKYPSKDKNYRLASCIYMTFMDACMYVHACIWYTFFLWCIFTEANDILFLIFSWWGHETLTFKSFNWTYVEVLYLIAIILGNHVQDKAIIAKPRPHTLDALFASMKEQRMVETSVNGRQAPRRRRGQKQRQHGRVGAPPVRVARPFWKLN